MTTLSSASKKRKMSEDTKDDIYQDDHGGTKSKKPKLSSPASQPAGKAKASAKAKTQDVKEKQAANEDPSADEYPNGFFYCHQCTRKRDTSCEYPQESSRDAYSSKWIATDGIHCTYKREKNKSQTERCRLKYCIACLKNRYQEDFDSIKSRDKSDLSPKQRALHVSEETFYYK